MYLVILQDYNTHKALRLNWKHGHELRGRSKKPVSEWQKEMQILD